MRIPDEIVDEVRHATDIVDLIGAVIPLKKRGKNYLGLCPFHQEKTPSFNVSSDRQMYHCFGCGVGGNVFSFLMEYEKVSFLEAIRTLAERANIQLPEAGSESGEQRKPEEDLYNICRVAAFHFYNNMNGTNEGKLALEYFKFRGFSPETMKTFGLGYSLQAWDALVQYAKEQNIPADKLEQAGLARRREDKSLYDYFRGRAMFPIFSRTGRVIGFGARKLSETDPLAKYINSPETPIYNKSKVLYGIYQSKEAIREKEFAILVEGYADLISVYQAGFKNIVASSGTALTRDQIRLLKDYTSKVVIMYDADSAGSSAALRGVDLILEQGLDVRVAELPEGHDPDTFVRKVGPKAFQALLEKAVSFIDYVASKCEREGKMATPEGQTETVRALVQIISKIDDEIKRTFYIKQIAVDYKLPEAALHRELHRLTGKGQQARGTYRQGPEIPESTLVPVVGKMMTDTPIEIPAAERDLIHAMVDGGLPIIRQVMSTIVLEEFTHPVTHRLAGELYHSGQEGGELDASHLIDTIEDKKVRDVFSEIIFSRYQLSHQGPSEQDLKDDPWIMAKGAAIVLKENQVRTAIAEMSKRKYATEEDALADMQRLNQLREQLRILRKAREE